MERISEHLDFHHNPLVSNTRSYIKDIYHFLSFLDKEDETLGNELLCRTDTVDIYPHYSW